MEESQESKISTTTGAALAWNGRDDYLFRTIGLSRKTNHYVNIFSSRVSSFVAEVDGGTSWQPKAIIDRKGKTRGAKSEFPEKLLDESEAIAEEIAYQKDKEEKMAKKRRAAKERKYKKREGKRQKLRNDSEAMAEVFECQNYQSVKKKKEEKKEGVRLYGIGKRHDKFLKSFFESSHYEDLLSCLQQAHPHGLTVEEIGARLPDLKAYVVKGLDNCGYHEEAYAVEDLDRVLRQCSGFRTDIQRRKVGRESTRYVYERGNPNAKKSMLQHHKWLR